LSVFIDAEETMTLKAYTQRTSLNAVLLLIIFTCLVFNPTPAFALGNGGSALPDFADFTKTVQNNEANVLRGVYVPDILALPVTQQPSANAGYVSSKEGEITQFGMAAQYGNIGLLAHNHLSGRLFPQLALGQEVRLVYGNGRVEYFVITQILQYQALEPTSQYSSFRDLTDNKMLTAEQLFDKVYRGDRHVTFQTCIANTESLSWGRLFVIAIPKAQLASMESLFDKTGR
jgi:hypothetical protein